MLHLRSDSQKLYIIQEIYESQIPTNACKPFVKLRKKYVYKKLKCVFPFLCTSESIVSSELKDLK